MPIFIDMFDFMNYTSINEILKNMGISYFKMKKEEKRPFFYLLYRKNGKAMSEYSISVIRLRDFQFNEEILLFQPIKLQDDELKYTLVIEVSQRYLVSASTKRVVRKCCAIFGTSLEESTRLSRDITGASNKLPIAIGSTAKPFVLIPTASPGRQYTSWIALKAIRHFNPSPSHICDITLINNFKFTADISTSSIHTQIARAFIIDLHYATLNYQPSSKMQHKSFTTIDARTIIFEK